MQEGQPPCHARRGESCRTYTYPGMVGGGYMQGGRLPYHSTGVGMVYIQGYLWVASPALLGGLRTLHCCSSVMHHRLVD